MWPFNRKKWEKLGVQYPGDRLKQILINGTGCKGVRLADNVYRAIPFKDFEKLAWGGHNDSFDYTNEKIDCDDFALFYEADTRKQWANKAKGEAALAFGQAKVLRDYGESPHKMIWQVDNSGNIHWIEGQTYQEIKAPIFVYYIEG